MMEVISRNKRGGMVQRWSKTTTPVYSPSPYQNYGEVSMKETLERYHSQRHELARQHEIGRLSKGEHDAAQLRLRDEYTASLGKAAMRAGGHLQALFGDARTRAADRYRDSFYSATTMDPAAVRMFQDMYALQMSRPSADVEGLRQEALRSGDRARVWGLALASSSLPAHDPQSVILKDRLERLPGEFLNNDPGYNQAIQQQNAAVDEAAQLVRELAGAAQSEVGGGAGAGINVMMGGRGLADSAWYVSSFFASNGNIAEFTPLDGQTQRIAKHGVDDTAAGSPIG